MEIRFEKLMAQFALLFVVLWVFAAATGKKSQVTLGTPKGKNCKGGSNPWRGMYSNFGVKRNSPEFSPDFTTARATSSPAGSALL